jgi:hypothetical protein
MASGAIPSFGSTGVGSSRSAAPCSRRQWKLGRRPEHNLRHYDPGSSAQSPPHHSILAQARQTPRADFHRQTIWLLTKSFVPCDHAWLGLTAHDRTPRRRAPKRDPLRRPQRLFEQPHCAFEQSRPIRRRHRSARWPAPGSPARRSAAAFGAGERGHGHVGGQCISGPARREDGERTFVRPVWSRHRTN